FSCAYSPKWWTYALLQPDKLLKNDRRSAWQGLGVCAERGLEGRMKGNLFSASVLCVFAPLREIRSKRCRMASEFLQSLRLLQDDTKDREMEGNRSKVAPAVYPCDITP